MPRDVITEADEEKIMEAIRQVELNTSGEIRVHIENRCKGRGEWNTYEVEAVGTHIKTWINGQPCVVLEDTGGTRRGVFGLQLHSGGPTEVRFRNLRLEPR